MENKPSKLKIAISIILLLVIVSFFFGGGKEKMAQNELQKIENQVADDAVKQYEIAKRNGTAVDIYVQASLVCAAYLQANDEVNYAKWKAIEKEAAKSAGMPVQ